MKGKGEMEEIIVKIIIENIVNHGVKFLVEWYKTYQKNQGNEHEPYQLDVEKQKRIIADMLLLIQAIDGKPNTLERRLQMLESIATVVRKHPDWFPPDKDMSVETMRNRAIAIKMVAEDNRGEHLPALEELMESKSTAAR